uniref:COPI_C domain-containing protein n=1 Tax=Macrostomum lignano TaxID=282301 RepID=A0A1I8FJS1_9PLAT
WDDALELIKPLASAPNLNINAAAAAQSAISKNDRLLLQLLTKGLLYEACVELCQARATSPPDTFPTLSYQADTCSLNLLQAPVGSSQCAVYAFACPFEEQQDLTVECATAGRPSLEASWAEQLLVQAAETEN